MKKTFRKSSLALAVAGVLGAGAIPTQAPAVNLATDGVGEVTIMPFYTTRAGWFTLLNLTNTSDDPVAVKLRVHEGLNSRDILDFTIAMSGNDVWTAVIREGDEGSGPVLVPTDADTCTVPELDAQEELPLSGNPPVNAFSGTDDRGASNDDGGPTGVDRMREGWVEFIQMGRTLADLSNTGVPLNVGTIVGKAIEDHDCAAVRQAFQKENIVETAQQFGEPINSLVLNARMLNPELGMEAGVKGTTFANFFNPSEEPSTVENFDRPADGQLGVVANFGCNIDRGTERRPLFNDATGTPLNDSPIGHYNRQFPNNQNWNWDPAQWVAPTIAGNRRHCANLIVAQEEADMAEPSLNDAFPQVGYLIDDQQNRYVAVAGPTSKGNQTDDLFLRGADAVSGVIQRATAINEWVLDEPGLGSEVSWFLTSPTKGLYVDRGQGRQFHISAADFSAPTVYGVRTGRPLGDRSEAVLEDGTPDGLFPPYPPFAEAFSARGAGVSCNFVDYDAYDRAEHFEEFTVVSPDENPDDMLCRESNVITFSGDDTHNGGVVESPVATTLKIDDLINDHGAVAGWMELGLTAEAAANGPVTMQRFDQDGNPINNTAYDGLPVIGFMLKVRDLGANVESYASAIEHSYTRSVSSVRRLGSPLPTNMDGG